MNNPYSRHYAEEEDKYDEDEKGYGQAEYGGAPVAFAGRGDRVCHSGCCSREV